ncbi:hypothetical protein BOTBODRAFT_38876 [Botryobasidium botryosum FD-172 SS1]|uniref:F-box domain-containing protein n=1 Tax=Botryobasidium botryosum (strain FD-172 SS1) TaxID=930990 RepID=A0A067M683_BOTB1|nr:hypothetical protein BOTBODRAFT_38876 [Botryobasidium botryosum FD-172 SS1]
MRASFLSLPQELTEHALVQAEDPRILAAVAQCSKYLYSIVYSSGDQHLWRSVFLSIFDDIRGDGNAKVDWKSLLQKRIRARSLLESKQHGYSTTTLSLEERTAVLGTLIDVVCTASPVQISEVDGERNTSKNIRWVSKFIDDCTDVLFPTHSDSLMVSPATALTARLRAYTGLHFEAKRWYIHEPRTISRAFVYDLRNYTEETSWGPFLPNGGGINWIHIDHLMRVICTNAEEYNHSMIHLPTGLECTRPYSAPESHAREPGDWAGVEGTWRRIICFMDYRDLFAYNFRNPAGRSEDGAHLNTNIFESDFFGEAFRVLEMELYITSIGDPPPSPSPSLTYSDEEEDVYSDPNRPTIYFEGKSDGGTPNESRIRGSVTAMPCGGIQWKLVSSYAGQERWCSSGAQVGGAGSAVGVVGAWSSVDHAPMDPSGPFWLWKQPAKPDERDMIGMHSFHGL